MEDLTIIPNNSLFAQSLIIKFEKTSEVLLVHSVLPAAESTFLLLKFSLCLSFPAFPTLCNFSLL